MSRGNSRSHVNSWIGYCRLSRTMITGYKKKKLGHPSEKLSGMSLGPECAQSYFLRLFPPFSWLCCSSLHTYSSNHTQIQMANILPALSSASPSSPSALSLVLFLVSLFLGPMLDPTFPKFGSVIAFIAHVLGVIGMVGFFEFLVSFLGSTTITSISNRSATVVP